ncbi:hypothetical protein Asp14428_56950 [Actinoplanes sp. NBRC 14428]|nr:hypothetical protein Asp14428_56950 [Actinoplanes sp. NBRC 14428]
MTQLNQPTGGNPPLEMNATEHPKRRAIPQPVVIGAYAFPHGDATSNRLLQLARSAAPDGVRSIVVNDLLEENAKSVNEFDVKGIQLITLRIKGSNRFNRMVARVARPARVLVALHRRGVHRGDVSVVLLPMAMMTLATWIVLRLALGCPVVVDATERHDRHQFPRGWLTPYFVRHRWSLFLATQLADRATAVSTRLAEYLQDRGLEVLVVPPQVDCAEHSEARPSAISRGLRLLYAGTPGRKDMLDVIVRGISQMSPNDQARIHLTIAGVAREDADAKSDLDVSVMEKVSASVEFLGRVPRSTVMELLAGSHFSMLVRPTDGYASFGFPSKVPESLASGCPVMLNLTSDLADYVQDGIEAVLLEGSTPDDVRRGIERALTLADDQWAVMSEAAKKRALASFDYHAWRHRVIPFVTRSLS